MTRDFDAIIIGAGQAVSAADSVFDDVHLLAGLHGDGCICWRILDGAASFETLQARIAAVI